MYKVSCAAVCACAQQHRSCRGSGRFTLTPFLQNAQPLKKRAPHSERPLRRFSQVLLHDQSTPVAQRRRRLTWKIGGTRLENAMVRKCSTVSIIWKVRKHFEQLHVCLVVQTGASDVFMKQGMHGVDVHLLNHHQLTLVADAGRGRQCNRKWLKNERRE
jgi:hypothetical protein